MHRRPFWIFAEVELQGNYDLKIQTMFYSFSHPLARRYEYANLKCIWYYDFARGLREDLELPENVIINLEERYQLTRISLILSQDSSRRELEEREENQCQMANQ